jgi:hypothetical protein
MAGTRLHLWKQFAGMLRMNKGVINILLKSDIKMLNEDSHFGFLMAVPDVLSLDTKIQWFNHDIARSSIHDFAGVSAEDDTAHLLKVKRENVLEDTFTAFSNQSSYECSPFSNQSSEKFFEKLRVQFIGENGSGPGLRREWFSLVACELFSKNSTMFTLKENKTFAIK